MLELSVGGNPVGFSDCARPGKTHEVRSKITHNELDYRKEEISTKSYHVIMASLHGFAGSMYGLVCLTVSCIIVVLPIRRFDEDWR